MKKLILIILTGVLFTACDIWTQINETIALKNCEFSLAGISSIDIAGVKIGKLSQLTAKDIAILGNALITKKVPVGIDLDMNVKNPGNTTALLNSFDWIFNIDNKDMLQGTIVKNTQIAAQSTKVIPFGITVDLYKIFSQDGINAIQAFAESYKEGKISDRISIKIKPSVTVSGTQLTYPSYITLK